MGSQTPAGAEWGQTERWGLSVLSIPTIGSVRASVARLHQPPVRDCYGNPALVARRDCPDRQGQQLT